MGRAHIEDKHKGTKIPKKSEKVSPARSNSYSWPKEAYKGPNYAKTPGIGTPTSGGSSKGTK